MRPEKRQGERHKVALPVQLESGGDGWPRDMSTSEVFFGTEASFSPGAVVPGTTRLAELDCDRMATFPRFPCEHWKHRLKRE